MERSLVRIARVRPLIPRVFSLLFFFTLNPRCSHHPWLPSFESELDFRKEGCFFARFLASARHHPPFQRGTARKSDSSRSRLSRWEQKNKREKEKWYNDFGIVTTTESRKSIARRERERETSSLDGERGYEAITGDTRIRSRITSRTGVKTVVPVFRDGCSDSRREEERGGLEGIRSMLFRRQFHGPRNDNRPR